MAKLLNIGFGNVVNMDKIVAVVSPDAAPIKRLVQAAKEAGLENLKGHRTVGGMRASIYNAMPVEGVEALVAFMKKFEEENFLAEN